MIGPREQAVAEAERKSAIHARSNRIDILSVVPIQTGDIGSSGWRFDVIQLFGVEASGLVDVMPTGSQIQRRIINAKSTPKFVPENLRSESRNLYSKVVSQDEVDAFLERNRAYGSVCFDPIRVEAQGGTYNQRRKKL